MNIENLVLDNLRKFDTWYDVAALCYDYLVSTIADQEIFIGEYILVNEQAVNRNPNLETLKNFEEFSNKTIHKNFVCICNGIKEILKNMMDTIRELLPYGEPSLNEAAVVYFLLAAIDRYAANTRNMRHTPAPLNREYIADSYIY